MKLNDKIKEITENSKDEIFIRGINNLENITKNSIDIFDDYLTELAGGLEAIKNRLDECETPYTIQEKNDKIIIEYDGSNVTYEFDNMLTEQYEFIAIVTGKSQGENFHADGDICKINKIITVFDKNGNQVETN